MNYLIEWYKIAKDWNSKQTEGQRRQSVFYEEIDAVLGCRDVAILHMAEAGTSKAISAPTKFVGQETSPEARTNCKKKHKRARTEEQDEDGELIESSMSGTERQQQDIKKVHENFTAEQQLANNMNLLVGALTTFLQSNANNK